MLQTEPPIRAAARLLIHADDQRSTGNSSFEAVLRRLRTIVATGAGQARRIPLRLRIEDLHGHRMLAVDDAGPLLEVPLPAGTYRVDADAGMLRRSYTMTLESGTSFDLHLRLGAGGERQ